MAISQKKDKKRFNQIVLIAIAGVFLLGSVSMSLAPLFNGRNGNGGGAEVNSEAQQAAIAQQVADYEAILEREPDNMFAFQKVLEGKLSLGDKAGAQVYLDRLETQAQEDPTNEMALQLLAQGHIVLGNFSQAIAPLESLIALYPDDENLPNLLQEVKTLATAEPPAE